MEHKRNEMRDQAYVSKLQKNDGLRLARKHWKGGSKKIKHFSNQSPYDLIDFH